MTEKRREKDGRTSGLVLLSIRLLMVGAICAAGYLAWTSLTGNAVAGCGPDSSCDKVLHSRWAYWLGIPVSLPALLIYIGVFALTFQFGEKSSVVQQRKV